LTGLYIDAFLVFNGVGVSFLRCLLLSLRLSCQAFRHSTSWTEKNFIYARVIETRQDIGLTHVTDEDFEA
jgi:hypothetical protein